MYKLIIWRNHGASKEERVRKPDINEYIKSEWLINCIETDNEEGSMSTSEHNIQHHETWEDYIRMERERSFRRAKETTKQRKASDKDGNRSDSGGLSKRGRHIRDSNEFVPRSRIRKNGLR